MLSQRHVARTVRLHCWNLVSQSPMKLVCQSPLLLSAADDVSPLFPPSLARIKAPMPISNLQRLENVTTLRETQLQVTCKIAGLSMMGAEKHCKLCVCVFFFWGGGGANGSI